MIGDQGRVARQADIHLARFGVVQGPDRLVVVRRQRGQQRAVGASAVPGMEAAVGRYEVPAVAEWMDKSREPAWAARPVVEVTAVGVQAQMLVEQIRQRLGRG